MNKGKNYPKDRDFLGLVADFKGQPHYWDIFFWATREDGINGKACFVGRDLFSMPGLVGWADLPMMEE